MDLGPHGCCAGGSPEGSFGRSPPMSTSNKGAGPLLPRGGRRQGWAAAAGTGLWHVREDGERCLPAEVGLQRQGCERARPRCSSWGSRHAQDGHLPSPLPVDPGEAHPSLVSPTGSRARLGPGEGDPSLPAGLRLPGSGPWAVGPAGWSHLPWETILGPAGGAGTLPAQQWLPMGWLISQRRSVPGLRLLALQAPRPRVLEPEL